MSVKYCQFNHSYANEVKLLFEYSFTDAEGREEGNLIAELAESLIATTNIDDLYGYCAIEKGNIVGSIFFSPLRYPNGETVFMLSPVAVATENQGRGIGQELIRYGFSQLNNHAVELVVTYGDPSFYGKLGFRKVNNDSIKPPYPLSQPEGWQVISLSNQSIPVISGIPACTDSFRNPAFW